MFEIDVWADVRCPWCWIGLRRLRDAIAALGAPVHVQLRSFLLEPEGPPSTGRTTAQVATSEWGMSRTQWEARSRLIRAAGQAAGLDINVDEALMFDSKPVHRLLKLAALTNAGDAESSWYSAFEAHFGRNENLGDPRLLRALAESWGLDRREAERALTGESLALEVMDDLDEAKQLEISSVPTLVRADGERISGTAPGTELAAFLVADGAVG